MKIVLYIHGKVLHVSLVTCTCVNFRVICMIFLILCAKIIVLFIVSLSLPLSFSLAPFLPLSLQLVLAVASMDVRMQASSSTPRLPSISSVGPTQTTLTHDVTEPPEISIQLPEVRVCKLGETTVLLLY